MRGLNLYIYLSGVPINSVPIKIPIVGGNVHVNLRN